MTPQSAYRRIAIGLALLAAIYVVPFLVGTLTAGHRLQMCSGALPAGPSNIVLKLGFVPGPFELEALQKFGRYGGSGGELNNVVLLRVSPENISRLSRIYWIDQIVPREPCKM